MRVEGGGSLARWVCLPLLALGLVWMTISTLHGAGCSGTTVNVPDDSLQRAAVAVVAALASLGTAIAALERWATLRRLRGLVAPPAPAILALGLLLLILAGLLGVGPLEDLYGVVLLPGIFLTGFALVVLLLAWVSGRKVDDVGSLVPIYVLGVSLFWCPGSALFALAIDAHGFIC